MSMVEAAGMRLRRTSRTLSALDGPRPVLSFQEIKPIASLARFQEFFTFTGRRIVRKYFSVYEVEFAQDLTGLALL